MGNIVKNNLFNILLTTCLLALLSFSLMTTTGCASKGKTPLGIVKEVIIGDDYYAAGENVGAISVTAYGILKGDPKHAKYTEKMEKMYEELKKADGGITAGSANEIALEIAQAALTAKYGYAKASLITTGIRIGGAVADRIIAKKVDEVAANQFLNGFKTGVDKALADLQPDAFAPPEKPEKKPFECPEGNCNVTITNRKVSHQIAVAQELIDGGYADKTEIASDGDVSKYDNIEHFIERCKILNKYKVKKTDLYIKEFTIEGGVLKTISFKMILDDGKEFDVTCVGCMDIPEIVDVE